MTSFKSNAQSGSRLITIGLFVGLPALLATLGAMNALQVADDQFTLAERQMQLSAFMRRLTAPAPDGRPVDLSPIYVSGHSATVAGANLQQYLVDTVASANGRLVETAGIDIQPGEDPQANDQVGIRASFDVDNAGLLKVLHTLESGTPLVDIVSLSIRRLPTQGDGTETLRIDVETLGHWRASP